MVNGEQCHWIHVLQRRRFNSKTKDRSQSLRALCAKFLYRVTGRRKPLT